MSEYSFLKDMPTGGPLDHYRKQATFDWKRMRLVFEDLHLLKIKTKVWDTLEKDPIFERPLVEPTTDQRKRISAKQLKRYLEYDFLPEGSYKLPYKLKTRYMMALNEALASSFPDTSVKHAIGLPLIKNAVNILGTERHKEILDALWSNKILACMALTEVAHGSNVKNMYTTATYDKNAQEFVINNSDFLSAKCWAGNLGKTATVALLFAQLITNGESYGIHPFVVPIRDPKTLLPYPGITVGDMGEKIGLHGIDNGFILFRNFRIPRTNLLNRIADVSPDGDYIPCFDEPEKIFAALLQTLSTGRVGIMQESANNLISAVTIAVRYAALRKQFSDDGNGHETPILEYQLHQWRLFPYVASAAVLKIFVNSFTEDYLAAIEASTMSKNAKDLSSLAAEINSLVCSAKSLVTWTCRDAAQECREACGGHGFLKTARLGDLRSVNDPCVTYEGDNHILFRQTSCWLLRQLNSAISRGTIESPLGSCSYLLNFRRIKERKFYEQDVKDSKFLTDCFEWLIVYLATETNAKQKELELSGRNKFTAINRSQVFLANELAQVYTEFEALKHYWKAISKTDSSLQTILLQFGSLYGLCRLDKHIVYFYQGGFCDKPSMPRLIRESILELCERIKPNVIGFIDAIAPPDFALNSILGRADGKFYEHLESALLHSPGALSRPEWWREVIIQDAPDISQLKSKL